MIQAVIFDMDGVISDTQTFHAQVESKLLAEQGIHMSPKEITEKYAGVNDEEMFGELFSHYGLKNVSIETTIQKKWEMMAQILKGRLKPIPHALELIKNLKKNNFKLAIASASTRPFIAAVLEDLQLKKYFDTVVSSEDVIHGKPAPDIFLFASQQLHVQPEVTVVIEDGKNGMQAAKNAGMICIGYVSGGYDLLHAYPADWIVTSLSEITLQKLQAL